MASRRILIGRAVSPIMVRPKTSAQRDALARAAKAAKVSLSYYLLESALMVAAEEGHTPKGGAAAAAWQPRRTPREGGWSK
jgi:hypothetical protein